MAGPLHKGMVLDRFVIETMIGAGSMGEVFRGQDEELGRTVAIKILSEKHRDNKELRARFVREGRAVAKISHPNVVQVFTTGTHDGRPYIAMEFLDGVDLGTSVHDDGTWSSLHAARAMIDASKGLHAAAKAGLIHRDVKPSNLVLLREGTVKVTDFGLVRPVDPGDEPSLTAMGVVVGTPDYIAPEQARGEEIDERVDIYALGGTLFFLLVGRPPFRTGDPAQDKYLKVVARHLREDPPDPRQFLGTHDEPLDDDLADHVARMMAKKPKHRPGYRDLIESFTDIVTRLERQAGPSSRSVSRTPSGKQAPTPFIAGDAPKVDDISRAARETEELAESFSEASAGDNAVTVPRIPTTPPLVQTDEPARVTSSKASPELSSSLPLAQAKPNRWLIGVTIVSVLVFLTGLGLLLVGPMPKGEALPAPALSDAAVAQSPDAHIAHAPTPPPGMLLVKNSDGTPRLFVSKRPVSYGELQTARKRPAPRAALAKKRATRVSHAEATKIAAARGARLPSKDEWVAASKLPGFVLPGNRSWEWVRDKAKRRGRNVVVNRGGKRGERWAKPAANISFRLAKDL